MKNVPREKGKNGGTLVRKTAFFPPAVRPPHRGGKRYQLYNTRLYQGLCVYSLEGRGERELRVSGGAHEKGDALKRQYKRKIPSEGPDLEGGDPKQQ